jgi:ammonia channel protein AmtB
MNTSALHVHCHLSAYADACGSVLGYSHAQRPAKQNQSTFAALMAGGMFSFIWANLLYPEGPTVMHLQDGVLAAGVAASTPACMFIDPVGTLSSLCFHGRAFWLDGTDMYLSPGMMLVGAGGTLVATLSFRFIQPKIADQDTQGVTSLHLLPGLWGALVMQACVRACNLCTAA